MSLNDQLYSLRLLIGDCTSKGLGLVILAPKSAANSIKERFSDEVGKRLWVHETDRPHELKIVNRKNESQVYVWVATCSQANLLSAIGEHNAVFMGYAHG